MGMPYAPSLFGRSLLMAAPTREQTRMVSRTWIPDPLEPGDPEDEVELPYQSDTDTEGAVPPCPASARKPAPPPPP